MHPRETSLIERSERQVAIGLVLSLLLTAGGVVAIAIPGLAGAAPYGAVAIFCGFLLAWSFAAWRRLFPQARKALEEAPRDLLLDRWFELSRTQSSRARLWEGGDRDHPLASFGWKQWSQPLWMRATREPARVYGAPGRGRVVVVSTPRGVLVGEIDFSRLDAGVRKVPRGVRWLLKPIRFGSGSPRR